MADKITNPDFFKKRVNRTKPQVKKIDTSIEKAEEKAAEKSLNVTSEQISEPKVTDTSIKLSGKLEKSLDELNELLSEAGQKSLLKEIAKIQKELKRRKFTVAVVGEFSKGKSTFINKFLEKDFLPTGDLPTTAMLTKIRYNPKEMLIVCDYRGNKIKVLPLSEKSWDGLTADINGKDPEGVVLAGVNSPWLQKTGIELEDTPGAGDLEEKRAKLLAEALVSDDGAIITISATAAMSMSEKLFIEQRLISPKTPYLMIVITKLDQIPVNERAGIVEYVKSKLTQWKWNIPVFVPYHIEMPDDSYSDIIGPDKVKAEMERWVNDPERAKLTERWLAQRIASVIDSAMSALNEQELLLKADDDKRQELIAQKKAKLSEASVAWDKLKLEMQKRNNSCYEQLLNIVDEHKIRITERLQYEASHANNPEKWWKEDYPYRLKVEIMSLSTNVDNFVTRKINEDIRWLNSILNNQYKTHVLVDSASSGKPVFADINVDEELEFEDINKKRNTVRVATAALSVAGFLAMSSFGAAPIIATMGVGTGSSIISEKIFKGKIEKQQAAMKDTIVKNVPEVIDNATSQSEKHLNMKYEEIIKAAGEQEEAWMAAQEEAIENSVKAVSSKAKETISNNKVKFEYLQNKIKNI